MAVRNCHPRRWVFANSWENKLRCRFTDTSLSDFRHTSEGVVEGVEIILVPTPTIDVNDPLVRNQQLPNAS